MSKTHRYHRKITHEKMPTARRKSDFWAGYLPFEITNMPFKSTQVSLDREKKYYLVFNNEFIVRRDSKVVGPQTIAIFALLFIGLNLYGGIDDWRAIGFYSLGICIIIIILCIVYYFTVPEKELILNRMQGLVTIPPFTYGKPSTMELIKMRLTYGGGATGSPSADSFVITRPTGQQTGYKTHLGGSYFEDLSFLIWYMDKNRPLPPGDAFDPYRKKDYQRRRAEGFPPPLFSSHIETPEHKAKWQREREEHWTEAIVTDENGKTEWQLLQSAENVARHGEWQEVVTQ